MGCSTFPLKDRRQESICCAWTSSTTTAFGCKYVYCYLRKCSPITELGFAPMPCKVVTSMQPHHQDIIGLECSQYTFLGNSLRGDHGAPWWVLGRYRQLRFHDVKRSSWIDEYRYVMLCYVQRHTKSRLVILLLWMNDWFIRPTVSVHYALLKSWLADNYNHLDMTDDFIWNQVIQELQQNITIQWKWGVNLEGTL